MTAAISSASQTTVATSKPAAEAGATDDTASGEFQSLLAVLLDLLAAKTAGTGEGDLLSGDGALAQSGNQATDLGGLIDLTSLLDLKAQIEAQAKQGAGDADTPDPLAAVLDLLIGALETAAQTNPEGTAISLDAKSGEALKALNAFLANLAADKSGSSPVQLPPETVDKLKTLADLLANQDGDPELAELKSRIADLLGTRTTEKSAEADPKTQSVAALLGQDAAAPKSANGNQRDVITHVLDGAKTGLNTQNGASSGDGETGASNQSPTARPDATPRQAAAGQDFAAQLAKDASRQMQDATVDAVSATGAQGADRLQQTQAQARAIPSAYTQTAQQIDLPQVAFEIARHAVNGTSRFQIRLDPPEMGRIDVRLEVDKSGNLHARLSVERPETLDLLQRDARALERALAQSGLDNSKTNLEFSLKQNPFARQDSGQQQNQDTGNPSWLADAEDAVSDTETTTAPAVTLYRGSMRAGGVNLVA